jgi:hypothetical protein
MRYEEGTRKKAFFFEKKKQKTFGPWTEPFPKGRNQMSKSFLVLFFKKELLPCFLPCCFLQRPSPIR